MLSRFVKPKSSLAEHHKIRGSISHYYYFFVENLQEISAKNVGNKKFLLQRIQMQPQAYNY